MKGETAWLLNTKALVCVVKYSFRLVVLMKKQQTATAQCVVNFMAPHLGR
jgi:hypothetical protein